MSSALGREIVQHYIIPQTARKVKRGAKRPRPAVLMDPQLTAAVRPLACFLLLYPFSRDRASLAAARKSPGLGTRGRDHIVCEQNCKPGSVFDSHLSRRTVAGTLKPPRERPGQPVCSHTGVAPNRVYSGGRFHAPPGALLPRLSTLTSGAEPRWRYISVALVLKSPSAGVTRYSCPVEPGLSSWTAFRPAHATVCLPRRSILQDRAGIVNRNRRFRAVPHRSQTQTSRSRTSSGTVSGQVSTISPFTMS